MQVMTDDKGRQIKITRCPFPETIRGKVRGVTIYDKDGFFVVLDSARGRVAQRRTLGHELAHIFLGHFDRSDIEWKLLQKGDRFITDREIEAEADRYAWKYYRLYEKHRRTRTPRQYPHRPTNNRLYRSRPRICSGSARNGRPRRRTESAVIKRGRGWAKFDGNLRG